MNKSEESDRDRTIKQYNLRPRPTRKVQFSLTQSENQLVMSIQKTL